MPKISGIYKIQSICKPERVYIGSAVNIPDRWRLHLWELDLNRHHSSKLQNHYNKYGKDDFEFSIIEPCLPSFLIAREQEYLDKLNPFFNIAKVAGSTLGISRTDEFKEKQRQINTGLKRTEGHRHKISVAQEGESNSMYGIEPWNKGKKGLQKSPFKGKKGRYSEETLERMRMSNKRAWEIRKQKNVA